MNDDATTGPNRTPAGVPTGGQFAASARDESPVTLFGDTGATLRGEMVDCDVWDIVDNGTLARGVSNKAKRDSLDDWRQWATERAAETGDARYDAFTNGLDVATVTLMGDHLPTSAVDDAVRDLLVSDAPASDDTVAAARVALTTKRASQASREAYADLIKFASPAAHNGLLTAGAILSGYENDWGLRADRDAVVLCGWAT